ncbi:T9SS type B sorting domain-containing protein [Rhodocytophaga rosea]|uniref:T9SS type B sorting domain-containing protein n=1 Tax=Rhodocytophaga rosea TaxID=2704465 RepID=A0A6C0GEL4_9BACT|nr:gliding motility-associated C-terminal domain-containing protein [Rhodocytophaga rosea]QHT66110.1 T9SS type B sorting domain-containing protein [Rhodocytophaga rosea]
MKIHCKTHVPYLIAMLLLLGTRITYAQTYPFARLTGSPVMDTKGWNLTGDAHIGDTNGDGDAFANEMVLCNPTNFNNGACFYNQPVNISECQKWVAEFDYRIYDGTAADGIAFCFLENPPTGFLQGGNLGIPSTPKGLMVILDTWLNCPNVSTVIPVPKLEIRYADGNTTYGSGTEATLECPSSQQPTTGPLHILRQPTYNRIKITYDFGRIRVFINNDFVTEGNYTIDFTGYFGLTASTGGNTDRHSIRDFVLYTYKPIVSPPNAGLDRVVCSGAETELGVPSSPNEPYRYVWTPATGLSDPTASNPKVTLTNNTNNPVNYTYFVTKDSLVDDTLCAYADAVTITVLGRFAYAGTDLQLCSGASREIGTIETNGFSYLWSPATGLSDPTSAHPMVNITNTTSAPVTYQYVLTTTYDSGGCTDQDTIQVTVLPRQANAGPNLQFCSGGTGQLGALPATGFTYTWSPQTGLDDATKANPTVTLTNTTGLPQTFQYIVTTHTPLSNCGNIDRDTVQVTVFPQVNLPVIVGVKSVCPNAADILYKIANPQLNTSYTWAVSGGNISSGQRSSQILVDWQTATVSAKVEVTASSNYTCGTASNSLPVKINVLLETEKPFSPIHPDTLCLNAATNIQYEVNPANGSVYTWGLSNNGVIVSGNGTHRILVNWTGAGTGKVWVNEQSTTVSDVCFGTSDTLNIQVAPLPQASQISGLTQVCAFTNNVLYSVNGDAASAYQWQVSGGTIVDTSGNSVTINWQSAGTGTLAVREITRFGCQSAIIEQAIAISPIPAPAVKSTDLAICPQHFTNLTYQVSGSPGSRFTWTIAHGRIISASADSSQIIVNWEEVFLKDASLTAFEISDKNCTGQVTFPLLYDASEIIIKSVSVAHANLKDIEICFQIRNAPAIANTFTISRRTVLPAVGEWTAAGSVSHTDTLFTDKDLSTDTQSFEYKIEGNNQCASPLASIYHHSIVVTGTGDEEKESIQLQWNDYSGWPKGVKTFQIWRKLDEETDFSLYDVVDKFQLSYISLSAKAGFRQCFRIRALEESGFSTYSWSNEVCLEFEHPLFIPNVITPNNDDKNDYWVIKNLELYPNHYIQIYNRFGKEVYRALHYGQKWDGTGLSSGVYFYRITTARNNQSFTGWVHLLR